VYEWVNVRQYCKALWIKAQYPFTIYIHHHQPLLPKRAVLLCPSPLHSRCPVQQLWNIPFTKCDRMLNHQCRRNSELHEELQIQAAVAAGDVCTVRRMLEQGYSPKVRDANGWTLLHFSAAKGKERCVRVFLEHGGETGFSFVYLWWP